MQEGIELEASDNLHLGGRTVLNRGVGGGWVFLRDIQPPLQLDAA